MTWTTHGVCCVHRAACEVLKEARKTVPAIRSCRTQIYRVTTRYHLCSYQPNVTKYVDYLLYRSSIFCTGEPFYILLFFPETFLARRDHARCTCLGTVQRIITTILLFLSQCFDLLSVRSSGFLWAFLKFFDWFADQLRELTYRLRPARLLSKNIFVNNDLFPTSLVFPGNGSIRGFRALL